MKKKACIGIRSTGKVGPGACDWGSAAAARLRPHWLQWPPGAGGHADSSIRGSVATAALSSADFLSMVLGSIPGSLYLWSGLVL